MAGMPITNPSPPPGASGVQVPQQQMAPQSTMQPPSVMPRIASAPNMLPQGVAGMPTGQTGLVPLPSAPTPPLAAYSVAAALRPAQSASSGAQVAQASQEAAPYWRARPVQDAQPPHGPLWPQALAISLVRCEPRVHVA